MGSRVDLRTSLYQSLLAFQVANTSLLESGDMVHSARPNSLVDRRSLFVGAVREPDIALDSGTWTRNLEVDAWCCVPLGDNEEAVNSVDTLGDAVIDWLAANVRAHIAGSGYVVNGLRSDSAEVQDGGTFVPAVVITVIVYFQTGRS